eukprot:3757233-Rhodomonas_salina.2
MCSEETAIDVNVSEDDGWAGSSRTQRRPPQGVPARAPNASTRLITRTKGCSAAVVQACAGCALRVGGGWAQSEQSGCWALQCAEMNAVPQDAVVVDE